MGRDLFLIRFILLSTLQKHAFRENKSLKIFFKKKYYFKLLMQTMRKPHKPKCLMWIVCQMLAHNEEFQLKIDKHWKLCPLFWWLCLRESKNTKIYWYWFNHVYTCKKKKICSFVYDVSVLKHAWLSFCQFNGWIIQVRTKMKAL